MKHIAVFHKPLTYQFETYCRNIINDCWITNPAHKCLNNLCATVMGLLKLTPFLSLIL